MSAVPADVRRRLLEAQHLHAVTRIFVQRMFALMNGVHNTADWDDARWDEFCDAVVSLDNDVEAVGKHSAGGLARGPLSVGTIELHIVLDDDAFSRDQAVRLADTMMRGIEREFLDPTPGGLPPIRGRLGGRWVYGQFKDGYMRHPSQ